MSSETRHTETGFRAAFEAMPGNSALVSADNHFTIVAVTEAYVKTSGIPRSELEGKGIFDTFVPDPANPESSGEEQLKASFLRIINGLEQDQLPVQRYDVLKPDGKFAERYWRATNRPVKDSAGQLLYILHTAEEITSEVKAGNREKQLQNIEQAYDLLMQAPVAIHILKGPEHIVELANAPTLKIWGKGDNVEGKPLFEVMPELRNQGIKEVLNGVLETGNTFEAYEFPFDVVNDGQTQRFYFNLVFQAYYGFDAFKPEGILVIASDVTERLSDRKEMEETEERFRTMAEGTELFIAVGDETGNAVYFNKAWVELTGRPVKQLLKSGWGDLIHPEDRNAYTNTYKEAFSRRKPFACEFRILNKEGSYRWLMENGPPRFRSDGSFAGYISSCIDITGNKEIQRALKESEGKLLSLVADAPFPIGVYVGKNMKISLANQSIMDTWGKGNDIVGKTYREVLPEVGEEIYAQLNRVYTTGIAYHAKNQQVDLLVNGELKRHFFNYSFTPLFDGDGQVYGVMNTAADITDVILSKQEVEESEYRYRTLIEESSVATGLYLGRELKILYANDIMLGFWNRKSDIIGKPMAVALPELIGQPFMEILDSVYTSGVPYIGTEEKADLMVNGTLQEFYFSFTYKALRDGHGRVYGIHHIAVDVTEEVLAKRALEESRNQLHFALEATELGTWDLNPVTMKFSGNDRLKEWFGLKPEAEIELSMAIDAVAEKDRQRVSDVIQFAIDPASNGNYDIEYTIVNPLDKKERIVRAKGKALFKNNVAYRFNGTLQDITREKLAMKELADKSQSLELAMEIGEFGVFNADLRTRITTYSPKALEWFGFAESEQTIDAVMAAIIPVDADVVKATIAETKGTDTDGRHDVVYRVENRITKELFHLRSIGQVIQEDGVPVILSGILQDVTAIVTARIEIEKKVAERTRELAEANSNLQKSNAELAQFAYIASHDLQEPLRKVSMFSQMLEQNLGEISDRTRSYLDKISSSTSRMTNLIRDVLTYSQLSDNKDIFVKVDLNEVFETILLDFELTIEQTGAVVRCDRLPEIEAIPLQMSQLFGNLLSNALKYKHEGVAPVITISASVISAKEASGSGIAPQQTDYCKLTFSDNGIGFKPEYAGQIFNIFQRLHRKSEYEGTGIGLAMCKKIAQNHYGELNAEGSSETGAVFNLILPLKQF